MNLIFTYCSGRCGTGYLSYIFGNSNYSKNILHFIDNNIVSHEPWDDIPVNDIKKLNSNSKEYFLLCNSYLNNKLSNFDSKNNIFITDHKIGRYFLPFLINSNLSFKILRINRDPGHIASSFDERLKKRFTEYNKIKYKKYYEELWSKSLFEPNDIFLNNSIESNWNNLSNLKKFYWYANEVSNQWSIFRLRLKKNQYLETNFLNFVNNKQELDKISNFIDIRYCENNINNKINI